MPDGANKAVEGLKQIRTELVERRRAEAHTIRSKHDGEALKRLVLVDQAIAALDKVIAEGGEPPEKQFQTIPLS